MFNIKSSSYEGYITTSYIDKTNKPKQKLTELKFLKKYIKKCIHFIYSQIRGKSRIDE